MNRIQALLELGLDRFSDRDTVMKAFRERAHLAHPDLNSGEGPDMDRLIRARDLLLNGDFGPHAFQAAPLEVTVQTQKAATPLILTLTQALLGGEVMLDLPGSLDVHVRDNPCIVPVVQIRRIRLSLPPGLRPGTQIRLAREIGETAAMERFSALPDQLYEIDIACPEGLRLRGGDIVIYHSPDYRLLEFGGPLKLETALGPIEVNVPRQCPPDTVLRLAGRGLPACEGLPAGDLCVHIGRIEAPVRQAHQLLEAFSRTWA